jgi:hypothetical protein
MRRREFIAGLGSAAAWPMVGRAQQAAVPLVGLLSTQSAEVDYKESALLSRKLCWRRPTR